MVIDVVPLLIITVLLVIISFFGRTPYINITSILVAVSSITISKVSASSSVAYTAGKPSILYFPLLILCPLYLKSNALLPSSWVTVIAGIRKSPTPLVEYSCGNVFSE